MRQDWYLVWIVLVVALLGLFYSFSGVMNVSGRAATPPLMLRFTDCIDTDLGFYPAQAGSTYDKYAAYDEKREDYCKDATTLVEYFCDEFGLNSDEVPCPNDCRDGVCQ